MLRMRMRKYSGGNARGESLNANPELSNDDRKPDFRPRELEKNVETENNCLDFDEKSVRTILGEDGNERIASASLAAPTWLEESQKVRRLDPSGEPYMNLDEFVSSLARKNCFPAEDKSTSHSGNDNTGMENLAENSQSSTVHSDDPDFKRLSGGSSMFAGQSSAELDTSLRLGPGSANEDSNKRAASLGEKNKAVADTNENSDDDNMRENLARGFHTKRRDNRKGRCTTDTTTEGSNAFISSSPEHNEVCGQIHTAGCASVEDHSPGLQLGFYLSSPSKAMKSSTDSIERRFRKNRRKPQSSGRKRDKIYLQAPTQDGPPVLASDHPARQPKRSLMFSLHTIYQEAGKEGRTAAEAVSIILQQGLPGLDTGACHSPELIAQLLRSSPYFTELENGKFALGNVIADEDDFGDADRPRPNPKEKPIASSQQITSKRPRTSTLLLSPPALGTDDDDDDDDDDERREMEVELERERKKDKDTSEVGGSSKRETPNIYKPSRSGRPKRLTHMKQDNVEELGNQCNRRDGKGWTCPLLAKTGYQLCDHHLDKLRCKPGSRSKYNKSKNKSKISTATRNSSRTPRKPGPL